MRFTTEQFTTPKTLKAFGSYLRRREQKLIRKAKTLKGAVDTTKLLIQAKRYSGQANECIFNA